MPEPSRDEVHAACAAFVAARWDPELSLVEWRRALMEERWATPTWPVEHGGRGLPQWADAVVRRVLAEVGAPATPVGVGMMLAAPTLLAHASPALCARLLPPLVTGEHTWCQLFSEPGAGSDLAGLTTRAVRDGDEWVVTGQKVWNTSAHHADYGLLVARTDWDVPKHRGLTYFAIPMRQPGVDVRPLRQMNRHSSFNEVFFDEARVPVGHEVGTRGDGWSVALTTLAFERRFAAMGRPRFGSATGRAIDEARAEADAYFATYVWYPQRAGRHDLLGSRAVATGVGGDPVVRQSITSVLAQEWASTWTAERAAAARALGRPPGAEGSIGKLGLSLVAQGAARAHSLIGGAAGMLDGADAPAGGVVAEVLVSVPAQSIAGGTDEIQRNIIGEKVLGLPREPSDVATTPFRDLPRNG